MNAGFALEESLTIPLTQISDDYLQFDIEETAEDEFLENEDNNTYHKSDSNQSHRGNKRENRMNDQDSLEAKDNHEEQKINLLTKLRRDLDAENLDKSSVGSTGGKFNQRDVFRKISKLIASKKAPRNLRIAMQIIIFLILASIGVSIFAGVLKLSEI